MNSAVYTLVDNQLGAVAPDETVWLSASAGTGKTQVLTARVLRLLLEPRVTPDQILCLTFTKAGATEMAARINGVLARWVRADDAVLGVELKAIGADFSPPTRAHARTLFASVLDCRGGGLRIDTIHAFCQWLLAAFPAEAGLTAGARPMEEHERALLARSVLAQVLVDAEARGDAALLDALATMALRMAEDQVQRFLMRCAEARGLWLGTGSWAPPLAMHVRRVLGLSDEPAAAHLAGLCGDGGFDVAALRHCLSVNLRWKTATGQKAAEVIAAWLTMGPAVRAENIDALADVFLTKAGAPRSMTSLAKLDDSYGDSAMRVIDASIAVRERRALLDLASWLTPALDLGRAFALAWEEAKAREGLIDFDDQIRRAADLLHQSGMAGWIRYKLDRRFDHILVDEAQDTNAAQWRIIEALVDDFFAGEGAGGTRARTLFVVGDYKQAIFGFQGTSPDNFELAGDRIAGVMASAAENAGEVRGGARARVLRRLGLGRSYRTAAPVLDFVDRAIGHLGHAALGLTHPADAHEGEARPGQVVFWRPVAGEERGEPMEEDNADPGESGDPGGETWLSRPDRDLADRIARQVAAWLHPGGDGFPLVKHQPPGTARRARAGDIMVLVRKRKDLAGLIVARLHAAGVPVAGVDRLRLGAPLGVRDLLAALRFAAQPLDDLSLASLLVSPLIGWSQEDLLEHGYRPRGVALWTHLRGARAPAVGAAVATAMTLLLDLLARADFEPVQGLLHWLLVGPWQGRVRLVARLGADVGDPIDELLNAAQAFAATMTPSLAGFLAWFDAGQSSAGGAELKRDPGHSGDQVRVMTVHGAKGLQAPIVILADATGDPKGPPGALTLPDPASLLAGEARHMPIPGLRAAEKHSAIRDAEAATQAAEAAEHWRLLYVAMTRAEEALFLGGALRARKPPLPPGSWYARLAELIDADAWIDDPIWGAHARFGEMTTIRAPCGDPGELSPLPVLPGWLTRAPADEPLPARPLVPSALGEDLSAEPPLAEVDSGGEHGVGSGRAGSGAARRGTLIHTLLERLPVVTADDRPVAAARWLARTAADLTEAAKDEIAGAALRVVSDARWADLFGPESLGEVPIAALVGVRMVTGTIDRLVIEPTHIRFVDFKTTRRPPATLAEIAPETLRQIAAYAAALEVTFPGRAVEAALLYTHAPMLMAIPDDLLMPAKHALTTQQQSLPR